MIFKNNFSKLLLPEIDGVIVAAVVFATVLKTQRNCACAF